MTGYPGGNYPGPPHPFPSGSPYPHYGGSQSPMPSGHPGAMQHSVSGGGSGGGGGGHRYPTPPGGSSNNRTGVSGAVDGGGGGTPYLQVRFIDLVVSKFCVCVCTIHSCYLVFACKTDKYYITTDNDILSGAV